MDQLASIFDGSRPKISRKRSTEVLLNALKECDWVSSYKLEKNDEQEFYQVYPKNKKNWHSPFDRDNRDEACGCQQVNIQNMGILFDESEDNFPEK